VWDREGEGTQHPRSPGPPQYQGRRKKQQQGTGTNRGSPGWSVVRWSVTTPQKKGPRRRRVEKQQKKLVKISFGTHLGLPKDSLWGCGGTPVQAAWCFWFWEVAEPGKPHSLFLCCTSKDTSKRRKEPRRCGAGQIRPCRPNYPEDHVVNKVQGGEDAGLGLHCHQSGKSTTRDHTRLVYQNPRHKKRVDGGKARGNREGQRGKSR